jgi:hypothetical protein
MNEQIKQLAEQAGLDYMPDHDLEKFAELIVAEHDRLLKVSLTALQSMKQDYLRKDGLGFDLIASSTMFSAIEELEQHFGVEE